MNNIARGVDRRTFFAGAVALGAATFFTPGLAWADSAAQKLAEADTVRSQITAQQDALNRAAEDYYKALDEHEAATKAVSAAQARIDDANAKITVLQTKLSKRARSMYRSGQPSVLDVMLGARSFEEFSTSWDLLSDLNDNDASMVKQAKDLREQVQADKRELEKQEKIAAERQDQAARIKDQAQKSVASLEATLQKLDAEAQDLLAQEQQAKRAAEAASAAAMVKRSYAYSTASAAAAIPSQGSVVDFALSRIGCPYVWGAEGPDTFDCSGLVTWAYRKVGINVPHQTESMYYAASARLPVSAAQPGDVLWISYGDGYNGHVGIACNAGGSHYVHAPDFGTRVRDTDPLSWAGFTHTLRFS